MKNPNKLYYHGKRHGFMERCHPTNGGVIDEARSNYFNIVEYLLHNVQRDNHLKDGCRRLFDYKIKGQIKDKGMMKIFFMRIFVLLVLVILFK